MRKSKGLKYDTDVEIINPSHQSQKLTSLSVHPSLQAIACLMGRQAAAHVYRYRFEGLGRIELIRLQTEARRATNEY